MRTDVPAHATAWNRTRATVSWASHWRRDRCQKPTRSDSSGWAGGRRPLDSSVLDMPRSKGDDDVANEQAQNAVATERFCARDRQSGRTQPQSRGLDASNAHSPRLRPSFRLECGCIGDRVAMRWTGGMGCAGRGRWGRRQGIQVPKRHHGKTAWQYQESASAAGLSRARGPHKLWASPPT